MPELPVPIRITRLHVLIVCLFIFVATMLSFVNAVNADFVNWDDDVYVTDNPHVQQLTMENVGWMFSHSYYYSWIPLTLLSHAVDVAVWGMNPKGHHVTNVVLHAFNAVWVFLVTLLLFVVSSNAEEQSGSLPLSERLTASIVVGSAIGAFLYAMHPLRVEPVAWVSGRKDLLCLFFLLPALGSFLLWRLRRREVPLVAAHLFFVLALLSKPMAATFPIILVLVEVWWMKKESELTSLFNHVVEGKTLLFLFSVIAIVVTTLGAGTGTVNVVKDLSVVERFLLPAYSILFYLWKIVVPIDLAPAYPELNRTLLYLSPVVFVGVSYGCFVLIGKSRNGAALAFFSFVIILLPTFLGLASGLQPIADRYTYLSTVSVFMFVGGCAEWLWRKSAASRGRVFQREFIFAILFVLCGVNAYRTIRHVAIWNNSVPLWNQVILSAPTTREEYESRKPYIKPNYLDAYMNFGAAYYAAGEKEKAIEQFNKALLLDSSYADAHYNLGNLMFEKGDAGASMRCFKNAVACDSAYAKAYYNMGILYAKQDSVDAAVGSFRKAARLGFVDAQDLLRTRGILW